MKFRYTARTRQGELQTGFIEGASREMATNNLISHELFILNIESAEKPRWYERLLDVLNRVKPIDLMVFTRQFATLLEAKISMGDSLKNVYRQTRNPILKEVISEVSSDIDAGLALSQSMEQHKNVFSDFYISMVRSAEVTGKLDEVVSFLADYLEKEVGLLGRVRNALIYPAIVVALFGVVAGIMVGVVFPQLEPVFAESSVQLPTITKVLLGSGRFVADWWLAILFILAVATAVLIDYLSTEEGRVVLDEFRVRMPVLGDLYKKLYVARFAESCGVLIRGGIPVAQALEISGHTIGSKIYQDMLHEVADAVRRGQLMSQALAERENYFPPLVSQMVSVGEATGKLESLLSRISAFFTREVDSVLANLVDLIQPAMIVGIGILIGALFAAVLIPIYNLAQTF